MTNKPNRRDALKALTAATGALSLAALPDEWTTPVINAGALPPHAQTSCGPATFLAESDVAAGWGALVSGRSADNTVSQSTSIQHEWLATCVGESCIQLANQTTATIQVTITTWSDFHTDTYGAATNWFHINHVTGIITTGSAATNLCTDPL